MDPLSDTAVKCVLIIGFKMGVAGLYRRADAHALLFRCLHADATANYRGPAYRHLTSDDRLLAVVQPVLQRRGVLCQQIRLCANEQPRNLCRLLRGSYGRSLRGYGDTRSRCVARYAVAAWKTSARCIAG